MNSHTKFLTRYEFALLEASKNIVQIVENLGDGRLRVVTGGFPAGRPNCSGRCSFT
jgi:hypothetical protein